MVCFYNDFPQREAPLGSTTATARAALGVQLCLLKVAVGAPRSSSCTRLTLALEVVLGRNQELRELLSHKVQKPFWGEGGRAAKVVRGEGVCSIAVPVRNQTGKSTDRVQRASGRALQKSRRISWHVQRGIFLERGTAGTSPCRIPNPCLSKQKHVQNQQDRPCKEGSSLTPPKSPKLYVFACLVSQAQSKAEPRGQIHSEDLFWSLDLPQL